MMTEQSGQQESEFVTRADQLDVAGTPLRRFKGTLDNIERRFDSGSNRMFVDLDFVEVEITAFLDGKPGTVVPYEYPIAQLNIGYRTSRSGRPSERGAWGLLVKSAEEQGFQDFMDLKGRRLLMEAEEGHNYGTNRETGETITGMVWRVAEVEGEQAGVTDETQHLLALLNGKTAKEFAQAALQDPTGRRHSQDIISGKLLASLVAAGKTTLEGDKYIVSSS